MSQADAIFAALEKEVARFITDATLEVTTNLIETTPVDTGFARSSWVPTIGRPIDTSSLVATPDIGEVAAQQNGGIAALLSYELKDGPVFVANAAPYIERLNDGSSTQQPAGFVEAAINKGVATAQTRLAARTVKL